jgi:hypothetical protein
MTSKKKKYIRKEPGIRSGELRWIQMPPKLDAAIAAEAAAVAAVDRRKSDYQGVVKRMCLDWLEGRTSDHPTTVPPEAVVRLGRPPKNARPRTASAPSTGAIADAQKPVDEWHESPTTK